ncbi:phosphodiester glycosidase family protein [Streptomyces sp. QHH-9511]|uniref:phosphodiester glycosidase family protein n=1 Tax=Streptomyces sp. QHH-9511 TaxID=2684468 RepID=UPI00131D5D8C|nr:phosphodiester glycosidase family protein [Streptomyces sp. QHH-9511]
MTRPAPRTAHRGGARLAAAVTALSSMLLFTASGPTSAAEEPPAAPELARWTAQTADSRLLAPGVEYFRYKETSPIAQRAYPRELNVVRIDPAQGALRIESTFGRKAATGETVREMVAAMPEVPLVAVNGGYFMNEGTPPGTTGAVPETVQTFGATVRDGEVMGASCVLGKNRHSVVLQYGVPYVTLLETDITVTSSLTEEIPYGEVTQRVDDVNRNPGGALGCPRDADDTAGELGPYADAYGKQLAAYTDPTEFVLFNYSYRTTTPKPDVNKNITADDQAGYEVVLDSATGAIITGGEGRGGRTVAKGQYVLQAIGDHQTDWLRRQHQKKASLKISQRLWDHRFKAQEIKREIPLDETVDVVNGGSLLIRDGVSKYGSTGATGYAHGSCARLYDENGRSKDVTAATPQARTDYCRDSRTAVGVDERGRTLLVTLSGPRDHYYPDGGFLAEVTEPLRALGVMDALNQDGGGSSTMLLGDAARPVNGLSDDPAPGVERRVYDSIYVATGGSPVVN